MKYVSPEHEHQLNQLAEELVTPERFGTPAVQASVVLHLPLPEVARVYDLRPHNPQEPEAA